MGNICRILHAEDSPEDAQLVRLALQRSGLAFTCERVDTEAAYAAALDRERPDVILCDYDMPQFSAEKALKLMHDRGLRLPFIVVSNHIDQTAAVIAMQRGASDYLSKSNLSRLAKAIEAATDRAQARAARVEAEAALRESEAMKRAILEALQSRIAVVDAQGVVREHNEAWAAFEDARERREGTHARLGENYLRLLDEQGNEPARLGAATIRAVTSGKQASAALDYQAEAEGGQRWFLARIVALGSSGQAVVSHQDITEQMLEHLALAEAHARLQVLSRRVLSIQEEERRSISRELHDDIGQTLTALKIGLHRLTGATPSEGPSLLADCVESADHALQKLRGLAQQLRPPQLDQLGLPDALAWLAQGMERASGLRITVDCGGMEGARPPDDVEGACYRIAQEAMNNAIRHGAARRIDVALQVEEGAVKLGIKDDGMGFDLAAVRARRPDSLGLTGMQERAELAGGRAEVTSAPGKGTRISAVFPVVAAGAAAMKGPT